jgi:hypothetical protein
MSISTLVSVVAGRRPVFFTVLAGVIALVLSERVSIKVLHLLGLDKDPATLLLAAPEGSR